MNFPVYIVNTQATCPLPFVVNAPLTKPCSAYGTRDAHPFALCEPHTCILMDVQLISAKAKF